MTRINKYIAESGYCSRRKADELVASGKVKINGVVVDTCGTLIGKNDIVTIDGVQLTKEEHAYYCMYKPSGIITSVSDDKGRKTIIDILPNECKDKRLFPVGRLDYDTKGIVLLTNDGDFMNNLVGPKSGIEKEYLARVEGHVKRSDLEALQNGIIIDGKKTLPALASIESVDYEHNSTLVRITITEGRYHQIKLMFKAINHPVKTLKRIRFGCITTEGLKEGDVRLLSAHEVKTLYVLSKNNRILKPVNEKIKYRKY